MYVVMLCIQRDQARMELWQQNLELKSKIDMLQVQVCMYMHSLCDAIINITFGKTKY